MSRFYGLVEKMAYAVSRLQGVEPNDMHTLQVESEHFDRSEAWLDRQLEPFEIDPDEVRLVAGEKVQYAQACMATMVTRGRSDGLYQSMLSMIASAYREGLLVGLLYEAGLDPQEVDVDADDSLITDHPEVPAGGWIETSTGRACRVVGVDRGGKVVAEIQLRAPTDEDPGVSRDRYHVGCFLDAFVRADDVPFVGGAS